MDAYWYEILDISPTCYVSRTVTIVISPTCRSYQRSFCPRANPYGRLDIGLRISESSSALSCLFKTLDFVDSSKSMILHLDDRWRSDALLLLSSPLRDCGGGDAGAARMLSYLISLWMIPRSDILSKALNTSFLCTIEDRFRYPDEVIWWREKNHVRSVGIGCGGAKSCHDDAEESGSVKL